MFSLIITILCVALVTALALAIIYYGGSAFIQGGDAARAAKYIHEGKQLSGAAAIVTAKPAPHWKTRPTAYRFAHMA